MQFYKKLTIIFFGLFCGVNINSDPIKIINQNELSVKLAKKFDPKFKKFAGVGALLIKDEKILLVHRKNTGKDDNKYGLMQKLKQDDS